VRIGNGVRHHQVIVVVRVKEPTELKLLGVAQAGSGLSFGFGSGQRRQEHGGQNGDNRDHYEKFDQSKTAAAIEKTCFPTATWVLPHSSLCGRHKILPFWFSSGATLILIRRIQLLVKQQPT
jgi:hypothetical protein